MNQRIITWVVVTVIGVAGLGSYFLWRSQTTQITPGAGPTVTTKGEKGPAIIIDGPIVQVRRNPTLGVAYLTDKAGMTLYLNKNDAPRKSSCFGTCAQTWPPFFATESVSQYKDQLTQQLNVFTREEAGIQTGQYGFGVTPLYYYKDDKEPGDIKGHGLNNIWSIVQVGGGG